MTKFYTVTGKSVMHPGNLPSGFHIELIDDGVFERTIGATNDHDSFTITVSQPQLPGERDALLLEFSPHATGLYVHRDQVGKIRDVLDEYLGVSAPRTVGVRSSEPPRDAVYTDVDGDVWTYDSDEDWTYNGTGYGGTWSKVTYAYNSSFPWTLEG